jgi:hypothetical protein
MEILRLRGGWRGVTKAARAIMPTESKSSGLCIIKQTTVYGVFLIYLRYTVKKGTTPYSTCSEDVINKTLKSSNGIWLILEKILL